MLKLALVVCALTQGDEYFELLLDQQSKHVYKFGTSSLKTLFYYSK